MEGTTLVVDRYSYSGVAYSAAKGKYTESAEKKLWRLIYSVRYVCFNWYDTNDV